MKRVGCWILALMMLVMIIPANAFAAEDTEDTNLNLEDHVEIKGKAPKYPQAPEGYESYDDYRNNSGKVHDTEFYYDQEEQTWYYYITNSSAIYSGEDLLNWTMEDTNRGGDAWAPCIVKLRQPVEYEDTTYTYALWDSKSTFGTRESWIRLWLSNSPKEGFVYAGDTVTSQLDDGQLHNAIDPDVFYDKEGKMWMAYGSFFGGIFLIELDPETCMVKNQEELPGKRIAYRSEYMGSIEGATILYNPDTDYYYLNVSYGSLDNTYNVRIGRSKDVEGPYYDYNGLPMNNEGYSAKGVGQIGTKITTPYAFNSDGGWYSTGHSAFLYNPDTDEYFLSHNARQETISGTRLNIRKIYWTEDGWPVVSPELYTGSETEQKIPTRCISGTYEVIELLRADLPTDPISAVKRESSTICLQNDHRITGAYEGTWIQTGEHTIKLSLGGKIYTATVATAWDWENWKECLIFTGISEAAGTIREALKDTRTGLCIWGKQIESESENPVELPYTDVKESDWYYDAVYYNYIVGTMTGLDEERFGSDETLARAQFAVILHRMNDTPEVEYQAVFPDVADNVWYTDAILWAADTGVVTGYSDSGKFGPSDRINREQMAVMMYRYATYKEYESDAPTDISGYKDAGKVSAFAKEAMEWAVGNGIISGKDGGTVLDPQGNATRAECATIIMRFLEKFEK